MELFYCKNSFLLEAAADSDFFQKNSSVYLSEDSTYLQISKFSELTEMCIVYASDVDETFSYLKDFLDYTIYDTVTYSILSILENDEELGFIHLSMQANNFVDKVVENIIDLRKCQIGGPRLSNLFKILVKCSQNGILSKDCQTPSAIEIALDIRENDNTCVLNAQWNLAYELCNSPCFKDHSSMLEYAISVIIPDDYETYNEFNVFAIDFISKTIENFPSEIKNIDVSLLSNTIVSIYKCFPDHTIALSSVSHLTTVLLVNKSSVDITYGVVVPFLIKTVESGTQKILGAYAINTIKKIVNLGDSDDNMYLSEKFENDDDFVNVCNTKIYRYEKIRMKNYGGTYRLIDNDDLEDLLLFPLKIPQTA